MTGGCTRPPRGWRCTREAGHEGPCAAVPDAPAGVKLAAVGLVLVAVSMFVRREGVWLFLALGSVLLSGLAIGLTWRGRR